ncbi:MAG: hypothetical protein ACI8PT_003447 [Gammaproteobacteria bacterium]|jgi:hypothetical protein
MVDPTRLLGDHYANAGVHGGRGTGHQASAHGGNRLRLPLLSCLRWPLLTNASVGRPSHSGRGASRAQSEFQVQIQTNSDRANAR